MYMSIYIYRSPPKNLPPTPIPHIRIMGLADAWPNVLYHKFEMLASQVFGLTL